MPPTGRATRVNTRRVPRDCHLGRGRYFAFRKVVPGPYVLRGHLDGLADVDNARITDKDKARADDVLLIELAFPFSKPCGGLVAVVPAEKARAVQESPKCKEP